MRRDSSLETFIRKRTANKISFKAGRDAVNLTFATSLIDLNRSIINQKVNQSLKFFLLTRLKFSFYFQYEYYYTYTCSKFGRNCKGLCILILQTTFPLYHPPPPPRLYTLVKKKKRKQNKQKKKRLFYVYCLASR